ncbi:MAG: DUF167 domain-containing protein [Candidatus Hodarchaeales archaeon]
MTEDNQKFQNYIIQIYTKPKSKVAKVKWDETLKQYVISTTNPATKDKANREILKLVKKFFQANKVTIISGSKSSIKRLIISHPKIIPKS